MITINCTGCGACAEICPVKCINMGENKLGHIIPVIKTEKCISCGLCKKKCPQNKSVEGRAPKKCYVAWSQDEGERLFSASGGIGNAFARCTIKNGGIVFGCDYDKNLELYHFAVKDENELHRIQSSKYSQSKAWICFGEIKKLLKANNLVMFIGTPCQVAGLKRSLGEDYDNLLLIDLVCHGTPPTKYLKEHINHIYPEKVTKIRFRGEFDQKLTIWNNNKIVYQCDREQDRYFSSFYQNMISRDSCFWCAYAKPERISDITIGDFWGIGHLNKIEALSERPSLVLINSQKGERFFEKAKEQLVFEEREVTEGIKGNGRLNNPPGKTKEAIVFQKIYLVFRFDIAVSITNKLFDIQDKIALICKVLKRKVKKTLKVEVKEWKK